MSLKKKLSQKHKLQARSAPPIVKRFKTLLVEIQSEDAIRFDDEKITAEAMISGIVLDFLTKSGEEQREILARRVPEFEGFLRGDLQPDTIIQSVTDRVPPPPVRKKRGSD